MSDYNTQTPPRSAGVPPTQPARSSSLSPIVFIVGGLVVAVGVLFWAMSDDVAVTTTPDSTDTSISIDNTTDAPAADVAVDPAPAAMDAAPAEPAPVEAAPAETTPAETAPAEPAPATDAAPAVPVEE